MALAKIARGLTTPAVSARAFATDSSNTVYAVFGATGGIGTDLVHRLARQDGAIIMLAGRSQDKLDQLKKDAGGNISTEAVDVMDTKEVEEVLASLAKQHGKVDGVVNLVGSMLVKPLHVTSEQEFRDAIQANLFSAFSVLKGSMKIMSKGDGGGSVVLTSAAVAHKGVHQHEGIAAAKGGVASMALGAASTYASKNIRVNVVAPGLIKTPMTQRIWQSEASLKTSQAMHPIGRIGEPGDVARAVEFLLHPSNSFITGQILGVDGGLGSASPPRPSKG